MSFEEQDVEAQIIEKLERIEDSLKSFIAGLEEPPEKKGRRIPVTVMVPDDGKITRWYARNHEKVLTGQRLCKIDWGSIGFSGTTTREAPVSGYLDIVIGVGGSIEAFEDTTIAYIEKDSSILI